MDHHAIDIEQARRRVRIAMENQREAQARADYAQTIVVIAIKQLAKLEEKPHD